MIRSSVSMGAFCIVLSGADAALAQGHVVECQFRQDGVFKGTPTKLIAKHNPGSGRMTIYDDLMKFYKIKPQLGEVERDTKKTLVVRWKLKNLRFDNGSQFSVRYTLNLSKNLNRAKIIGQVMGVPQQFTGTGNCVAKSG